MTVEIAAGELRARFEPELAMVCTSLRHGHDELLALPNPLAAYRDHGKTTGIPLLFPWANRLGGLAYAVGGTTVDLAPRRAELGFDGDLPIHGVRPGLLPFVVTDAGPAEVRAAFESATSPALAGVFPFPLRLTVRAAVDGDALTIETTLAATGTRPVPVTFGYHPYFRLPGSPRDAWSVDVSARRRLVLDARKLPTGATEPAALAAAPLAGRAFDDAFSELGDVGELAVTDGRWRIAVRLEQGYPYAQVYAPQGRDLVALEPMTAPADALRRGVGLRLVDPGTAFTARFAVAVTAPAGG